MKKENIVKISIGALFVLAISLVYYFKFYSSINTASEDSIKEIDSVLCSYMIYDTAEDLINGAELIVIASTSLPLEERKSNFKFMDNGVMSDYYTLTDIDIKTILKQPKDFQLNAQNRMEIIEPCALADENGKKVLFKTDSYFPLLKNNDYIIFLRTNGKNVYGVINMYRGKFNLSVDEENSADLKSLNDSKKSKYIKMKKDVAQKYSLKIKEKN